jgi:hypothetical protein
MSSLDIDTIGPVPSSGFGSVMITFPRAKLPITPPRALTMKMPRPSRTDRVPSFGLRVVAVPRDGNRSATRAAVSKSRFMRLPSIDCSGVRRIRRK